MKIATFFKCLFLLSVVWSSIGEDPKTYELVLPIHLNNPDGSELFVNFTVSANHRRLEFVVADFCERYNIRSFYCRKLFETVVQARTLHFEALEKEQKVYPNRPPDLKEFLLDEAEQAEADRRQRAITSTLKKAKSDTSSSSSPFEGVPNKHLLRNPAAMQAELLHNTDREAFVTILERDEAEALQRAKQALDTVLATLGGSLSRIVVIHSCLLEGQDSHVLQKLLQRLETSQVISETTPGIVLVFHYGEPLPSELVTHYSTEKEVVFVPVSRVTSFFEIPTLRLLSALSQYMTSSAYNPSMNPSHPHVLYLHTKGVSYSQSYPQIEDWVELMLYYLVERHQMSYHLLESLEFDAVGVNYCSHPYRMFSGNFWWSTVSFLSTLPRLDLIGSHKYDAEKWLFLSSRQSNSNSHSNSNGNGKIRVYIPHTSNVYHASSRYPPFCYRQVSSPPPLEVFRAVCGEDHVEEYLSLHSIVPPAVNNHENQERDRDVTRNVFPSSARCNALELYHKDPSS